MVYRVNDSLPFNKKYTILYLTLQGDQFAEVYQYDTKLLFFLIGIKMEDFDKIKAAPF